MRRALSASALALLLAGCAEPVFVPEAGPGAPGYTERSTSTPPAPDVELVARPPRTPLTAGGAVDSVVPDGDGFKVIGWARVDADAPRGVLELIVPRGMAAELGAVETVPRPDVVSATGDEALLWSGFAVTVRGPFLGQERVCVLSRSRQGEFRLAGSDERLCPS